MPPNFNMIYDKYKLSVKDKVLLIDVTGSWTIKDTGNDVSKFMADLDAYEYVSVQYNFSKLNNLDTVGAFILSQALRVNLKDKCEWMICNSDESYSALMKLVIASTSYSASDKKRRWYDILTNIGKGTDRFFYELVETLAFLGQFFMVFIYFIFRPHKVRWKSVVSLIEEIGVNAVPIVMTLCFLSVPLLLTWGKPFGILWGFNLYG